MSLGISGGSRGISKFKKLITGMVDNIVTAWSNPTTNAHIPSEKLAKDTLDLKSNLAGGNTFSGKQNFSDNIDLLSSKYQYIASSTTADSLNDIRVFNNGGIFKVERCTLANATKGAGTWTAINSQIVGDATVASASIVGCVRYIADSNNSYLDMCMQTAANTYTWVTIKQNTW